MAKIPKEWTREDLERVERAITEHRLNRVDLHIWRTIDVEGRSPQEVARQFMTGVEEIEARLQAARGRLESTFDRPWQEAYLGQWLNT